jgi:hypothetical protein
MHVVQSEGHISILVHHLGVLIPSHNTLILLYTMSDWIEYTVTILSYYRQGLDC